MQETESIRRFETKDRPAVVDMLERTSIFYKEEVEVAIELLDTAINVPMQTDYNIFVLERDGQILGYHCTGRRPMTDGVFDLYWIAVNPSVTGNGAGSKLLKHAEEFVKVNGGRWILAETSSREQYAKTRNFYIKHEYQILANIPDFYKLGDGMVVFGKSFLK